MIEINEQPNMASKTLQVSNSEVVCGLGIGLFCVSLAIPAIKHGKDFLGIECFTIGLLFMFRSANDERQLISLVAHLMHLSALIPILIVWNRKNADLAWKLLPCLFAMICITCLLTVPYSNIERVYVGYYIWLFSIAVITLSPFIPPTRISRN